MTLLDIERLVRRITGILRGSIDSSLAPKLADDYVSVCRAASLRLLQCEAMVRARDFAQAIQLAETTPNLLDCVTLLEFREIDEWREYCRNLRLPVPEPFDPKSVRLLNECYMQGIKADDPLYKRYRKAVLTKDDPEALAVLKTITRVNPGDENAVAELARLDKKVMLDRLTQLSTAIAASRNSQVIELISSIEAFGFQTSPAGDVWSKAQLVRSVLLLDDVEPERQRGNWREILLVLDFIKSLQAEFHFALPVEAESRLAGLETWARGEESKYKREKEFQSLLSELHFFVEQSEQNDMAAREVTLKELRTELETLQKPWRSLEQFSRPIPADIETRFRKRSKLLQMEVQRRASRRLTAIGSTVATALLFLGVITWFFLGRMRAGEFAERLNEAVEQKQVATVEKLLKTVRESESRLMSHGKLSAAVAQADNLVVAEKLKLQSFEGAFAKLPASFTNLPGSLVDVQTQFIETTNLLAQLSAELKGNQTPKVLAFQNRWEAYLAEQTAAVNLAFDRTILQAEQLTARLDHELPLNQLRERLSNFSSVQAKLNEFESGFKGVVKLSPELLKRSGVAQARAAVFQQELARFDQHVAQVQSAKKFEDYAAAVKQLSRSEFSSTAEVKASTTVETLRVSPETILSSLLNLRNPSLLSGLQTGQSMTFTPKAIMPAERDLLRKLLGDETITKPHYRYRLLSTAPEKTNWEWLATEKLNSEPGWKKITVYRLHANRDRYLAELADYGYFSGKFFSAPLMPFEVIEDLGLSPETSVFSELKLATVLNPAAGNHTVPLLQTLDQIKDSTAGSSLFRAYLSLRLIELMELQPEGWGVPMAPAVQDYRTALQQAGADSIGSGDWYAPAKATQLSFQLDKGISAARRISFWKQAQGISRLAKAVADGGLTYVGFIDLEGQPKLISQTTEEEIIGYREADKTAALLFKRDSSGLHRTASPLPLSPLFRLEKTREKFLERAEIDISLPEFAQAVPPFFKTVKEAK